jgi:cytochrome bd ubiquinol oxidase subunit II
VTPVPDGSLGDDLARRLLCDLRLHLCLRQFLHPSAAERGSPSEPQRNAMIGAVAPVWDGNETWLVVSGVILWGAFPIVYSTLMSAFYLRVLVMLAGLILRGVAFEFRPKTERMRWIWNASFAGGSLVAAFMQGLKVGPVVEGLPLADGRYLGGEFGWLSPFAVLCGIGLCVELRAPRRLLARREM